MGKKVVIILMGWVGVFVFVLGAGSHIEYPDAFMIGTSLFAFTMMIVLSSTDTE